MSGGHESHGGGGQTFIEEGIANIVEAAQPVFDLFGSIILVFLAGLLESIDIPLEQKESAHH